MPTNFEMMRARLHAAAGLFDPPDRLLKLEDLEKTEWSPEFERLMRVAVGITWDDQFIQLMRNRLIMGAMRYSTMEQKRRNTHRYDLLGALSKKMSWYERTGNTEALVDAANYMLLEFEVGAHIHRFVGDGAANIMWPPETYALNYVRTGNASALAAGAVALMNMFGSGYHRTKHFTALDDAGGHCQEK